MEVTSVFPPPASPTEGDYVCEIDVATVAIYSVSLIICLCGLPGNGAVLWVLVHCSSRNSTILYIPMLTLFDFLFLLLFLLPSSLLFLLENVSCSIIMPLLYMGLLFIFSQMSHSVWLYTLTFISIKRCRSIHCPLWHCCHRPRHLSWVVCALSWAVCIAFITVFAMISLCGFQISEHCWVFYITFHAFNLLLCAPFMFISSTILFTHFKPGSQQQQPKKLDIVICLIVLFSLPLSLWSFLQQLGYTTVTSQVVFLLTCITSSINPFIFFLVGSWKRDCSMGSCWTHCSMESCRRHSSMQSLRKAIHRVFDEPKENTAHSDDPSVDTGV